MPRLTPILNLRQVHDLLIGQKDRPSDLFHCFGIFAEKKRSGESSYYVIFDEHRKIEIKLAGRVHEFDALTPKPGDIVRIHRMRIFPEDREVRVCLARNVVVWPGFQDDPKPRFTSRDPTLKQDDDKRRRALEKYFCTRRSKLIDLSRARIESGNEIGLNMYDIVAGRLEKRTFDLFDHADLLLSDGSGVDMYLKVFRPKQDNMAEVKDHYDIATQLEIGQYVVATSVKLRQNKEGSRVLNLSANFYNGRSFSIVDPMSELGEELAESIAQHERSQPARVAQPTRNPILPRRSPRFLPDENAQASMADTTQDQPAPIYPEFPPQFIRHNSIKPDGVGRNSFAYYNIVGVVRGEPNITSNFGNLVVQIHDGSNLSYPNYFRYEVKDFLDDCMIVYIYCKQKDLDTDEHFNMARSVKEGDLVYITNVKITFKGEPIQIRAELNANIRHSKSFNVINKDSIFGGIILEMSKNIIPNVSTPKTHHVLESISQPDESFDEDDRRFLEENPY